MDFIFTPVSSTDRHITNEFSLFSPPAIVPEAAMRLLANSIATGYNWVFIRGNTFMLVEIDGIIFHTLQ